MSQEKLQTMVMQKFWGVIEVYYGIVQVVNNERHDFCRVLSFPSVKKGSAGRMTSLLPKSNPWLINIIDNSN